jgi:hypothetical protein
MRMAGFFPSVPMQVYFEMLFTPVQGQWRLIGIGVDVGNSIPAAPTLPGAQSPATTPAATQSPVATPQPAITKAEPAQSPSIEINPKPKPSPTPRRKL